MRILLFLFIFSFSSNYLLAQEVQKRPDEERRILVLSGGGARGAWGGGLAQTLCQDYNYKHEYVVGNSTGSLLAPLVLISEYDRLKEAYTGITQKDIFKGKSPFHTKGSKKGDIRVGKAFFKVLFGSKTLGNTKRLKGTIKEFFTEEFYERIKSDPSKDFYATVLNFTMDSIEYKSASEHNYKDIVNWMWASANQPVFMSLFKDERNDHFYVDGGSKENVPILKATQLANDNNIKHIDVIVHNTEKPGIEPIEKNIKILGSLFRTINILTNDVKENDIFWAKMISELEEQTKVVENAEMEDFITITIYFMSEEERSLIPQTLLFEKEKMTKLWDAGEKFFQRDNYKDYRVIYKIPTGKKFERSIVGKK